MLAMRINAPPNTGHYLANLTAILIVQQKQKGPRCRSPDG